jgi:hypothetical protein
MFYNLQVVPGDSSSFWPRLPDIMSLSPVFSALISAAVTISSLPASQLSSCAALLGVASHWAYFIHGELDGQAWGIFLAFVTLPPSLAAFLHLAAGTRLLQAIITTTVATTSYLLALGVSILVYRLILHPSMFSAFCESMT